MSDGPPRFRRLSVAAQPEGAPPPARYSRIIPPLAKLCPGQYPPGTDYGDPLLPFRIPPTEGRFVRLGQGPDAVRAIVNVMAAPPRPTLTQLHRGGAACCSPGYLVTTEAGEVLAVSATQVRELNRKPREGLCPYHRRIDRALAEKVEALADRVEREGIGHPRDFVRDMPFPHRKGSSPCCEACEHTPEKVLAALGLYRRLGAKSRYTPAALLAMGREAIPRGSRVLVPRNLAELETSMRGVRDHCWDLFAARVATARQDREEKFQRLKRDLRSRYSSKRLPK